MRRAWLAAVLVVSILAAGAVVVVVYGPWATARFEGWAAARALQKGDLDSLEERLAENRGNEDFAFSFASQVTPRELGDALATVAGASREQPLRVEVDPDEYELILTDLAGALALASQGAGDLALPKQWTTDFIAATTTPADFYRVEGSIWDWTPFHKTDAERRREQDAANKANLLLLLSRGAWSTDFLQAVTRGYHAFDRAEGDDAWPAADPDDEVGWAPSPQGSYLTDGILALTAALTANPEASRWAFTDFQPGRVPVEGFDHQVGRFTHFLMFEHRFPEAPDGEGVGTTAVLTALGSAMDAAASGGDASGPALDGQALQLVARQLGQGSGCSLSPADYGHCVIAAAKAAWRWIQQWGHAVLGILSLPTFAPPPIGYIALAAAATNATWYVIEGDYAAAGLSLAVAVPGLAYRHWGAVTAAAKAAGQKVRAAVTADRADKLTKLATTARKWHKIQQRVDTAAAVLGRVSAALLAFLLLVLLTGAALRRARSKRRLAANLSAR